MRDIKVEFVPNPSPQSPGTVLGGGAIPVLPGELSSSFALSTLPVAAAVLASLPASWAASASGCGEVFVLMLAMISGAAGFLVGLVLASSATKGKSHERHRN